MKFHKTDDSEANEQDLIEKKIDEMMYLDPAKKQDPLKPKTQEASSKPIAISVSSDDLNPPSLDNPESVDDLTPEIKTLKIDDSSPSTIDPIDSTDDTITEGSVVVPDQQQITKDNLEDNVTESAIDDIVSKESDEVLEVEDQTSQAEEQQPPKKHRISKVIKNKWFIIGLVIVLLLVVFGLPYSRYKILGLFLKSNYQIELTDSITNHPISGAKVSIDGVSLKSNASGIANFKLPLGEYKLSVSKQFYNTYSTNILFGLSSSKKLNLKLNAYGRQFSFKISNSITAQPLAGVQVSYNGITSLSNASGIAYMVLPARATTYNLVLSANGYNNQNDTVKFNGQVLTNNFSLTPSGKVYFLSQSQGVINVVSANLDGTDQKIIVPGTSSEQPTSTFLMASPDWKYLILEANMKGTGPGLYVINTATKQINEFDSSNSSFSLIGWSSSDQFLYDELSNTGNYSGTGNEQIKSYDANTQSLNVLDQDQVVSSAGSYAYQSFNSFNIINNNLVYSVNWNSSAQNTLSGLTNSIRQMAVSGSNKKDILSLNASNQSIYMINRVQPNLLYIAVYNNQTTGNTFYRYTNGSISPDSSLNSTVVYQPSPVYSFSPSGSNAIWTSQQNNQPVVFSSDLNYSNPKQLSIPVGYSANSWYNNQLILVTKKNNLYVTSLNSGANPPLLISNFLNLNSAN